MAVAFDAILARIKDVCKRNGLLILSVLSVTIGCLLGFFLRTRRLSQQEISYFQFPGELLMRMLKMLILPLVVSRGFLSIMPSVLVIPYPSAQIPEWVILTHAVKA